MPHRVAPILHLITNLALFMFVKASLHRAHLWFCKIEQKIARRMTYFAADVTF